MKQRGLTIKNTLVLQGKLFKPDSSLKYFDSKLTYYNLNKFNFGRDTSIQVKYTPVVAGVRVLFLRCLYLGFYALIQSRSIKDFRDELKMQLSKKNSGLAVDKMISNLNTILTNLCKYYDTNIAIKKHFFLLNDLVHKLFYKYLLRKYSSLPKIYSYIKTQFKFRGKFAAKNEFLFRVTGSGSLNIANFRSVSGSTYKKVV